MKKIELSEEDKRLNFMEECVDVAVKKMEKIRKAYMKGRSLTEAEKYVPCCFYPRVRQ